MSKPAPPKKPFTWPDEKDIKKASRNAFHCKDCYKEIMMEHAYVTCSTCGSNSALDYMVCCATCAKSKNRCCGCGHVLQHKEPKLTEVDKEVIDSLPASDDKEQEKDISDYPLKKLPTKKTAKMKMADVGRQLKESHERRAESFTWPDENDTKKKSGEDSAHCVDCVEESMMQHVYVSCNSCNGGDALDYMVCCPNCAKLKNRCCGCGHVLKK